MFENLKFQNWRILVGNHRISPTALTAMLFGLMVLTSNALAQEVLAPLPRYPVIPPALQQFQTNQMAVFQPTEHLLDRPPETQPFRWGPVTLRPYVLYQFLYGDGMQASPGQPATTTIQQIAPGLQVDVGSHWSLNYTPSWTLYSNHQFGDSFGQSASITGGTAYENWILGLALNYDSADTTLVETGGQTREETLSTPLTATYRFSREMSLELAVYQNFLFAEDFIGYRQWSTLDWFDYQFFPRFSAAIGAGVGYTDVTAGTDMTYEQLQGRINWRATDKVSLQIRGGMEDRQFLGAGLDDLITPVFGAAVQYQPFANTRLSVNFDRVMGASYFTNQVAEATGFTGNLTQRLLQNFYLSLGGGYNKTKYIDVANGFPVGRVDEYYSFNVRLSTGFLRRGTIAALYSYNDNFSNQPGYGYTSNQFGFEIGFRY